MESGEREPEVGGKAVKDYTPFPDPNGLQGARLGVARQYFGKHPQVDAIMETSLDVMRRLGAQVVDLAAPLPDDDIGEAEVEVLLYEFKADSTPTWPGLGPFGAGQVAGGDHRLQRATPASAPCPISARSACWPRKPRAR